MTFQLIQWQPPLKIEMFRHLSGSNTTDKFTCPIVGLVLGGEGGGNALTLQSVHSNTLIQHVPELV